MFWGTSLWQHIDLFGEKRGFPVVRAATEVLHPEGQSRSQSSCCWRARIQRCKKAVTITRAAAPMVSTVQGEWASR